METSNFKGYPTWIDEFQGAVTVCDCQGVILYMNNKAQLTFSSYGGQNLIGKSLFDCHQAISSEKIKNLINTGESNHYTILKNGVKKIIHQMPWFSNGKIAGLVEISIEIPAEMNHFNR